jgi:flagellar basal body-associated protein FliL
MRNDWFFWYLVGRRRGRREALEAMEDRPRRGTLRILFLFVLCVLLLSAIVYAWAFVSTALERTH